MDPKKLFPVDSLVHIRYRRKLLLRVFLRGITGREGDPSVSYLTDVHGNTLLRIEEPSPDKRWHPSHFAEIFRVSEYDPIAYMHNDADIHMHAQFYADDAEVFMKPGNELWHRRPDGSERQLELTIDHHKSIEYTPYIMYLCIGGIAQVLQPDFA